MNRISRPLYKGARISRDANAIIKSIQGRSIAPLLKRIFNKIIGRTIVSKLWWR